MIKWYYATPQKTHHEFSEEEVPGLLRGGAIQPETLIWNGSMADWKPAREAKPEWFSQAAPSQTASAAQGSVPAVVEGSPPAVTGAAPIGASPSLPGIGDETDPLALASLVCGIVAVALVAAGCAVFPCIGALGILAAIPAIVTGHMALGRIKSGAASPQGRGLAACGLIMGYVTLGLFVVGLILAVLGIGAFAAFGASQAGGGIPSPF